jgi:hypothetical protein
MAGSKRRARDSVRERLVGARVAGTPPAAGSRSRWPRSGLLLLNTVGTVGLSGGGGNAPGRAGGKREPNAWTVESTGVTWCRGSLAPASNARQSDGRAAAQAAWPESAAARGGDRAPPADNAGDGVMSSLSTYKCSRSRWDSADGRGWRSFSRSAGPAGRACGRAGRDQSRPYKRGYGEGNRSRTRWVRRAEDMGRTM